MSKVIHVSNETELEQILHRAPFVLVDFYSIDCPPCEKFAPIYERLADEFNEVTFVKLFRQGSRAFAESHEVRSSPTVLFFLNGKVQQERFSGDIRENDVRAFLQKIQPISIEGKSSMDVEERDLCIIGAGPAGFSAAVYAARYHVDQVLVGELPGGLMTSSHKICNFPSEKEITGMELTKKMHDHVQHLGVPLRTTTTRRIIESQGKYEIELAGGGRIRARAVLLATGTKHRRLGIPREEELIGRGVSYCATCDGSFFRQKTVAVIGGSDSAHTAALYLAEACAHVYQIYRGDELRGETEWISQVQRHPNITVLTQTNVTALLGDTNVQGIEIDRAHQGQTRIPLEGVFIEIGSEPDTTLIDQLELRTDQEGYIATMPDQRTSREGVWAAGDITTNSDGFRQIVTACSEGAVAARSIFYALKKMK